MNQSATAILIQRETKQTNIGLGSAVSVNVKGIVRK
jgi:hypothetical protein